MNFLVLLKYAPLLVDTVVKVIERINDKPKNGAAKKEAVMEIGHGVLTMFDKAAGLNLAKDANLDELIEKSVSKLVK